MRLIIKQKVFSIGDKYNIYDEYQNPYFVVGSEIFTFGAKIRLYDLYNNELYYIEQKVFKLMPEYNIYERGNYCARVKKEFTLFKQSLNIQSVYGNFAIDGDMFGWNFNILREGFIVGKITKMMAWGDTYELDISDNENIPFICSLVIAIDNCIHNEDQ